jgi:RNA polymerase sigma factor (sigma-70 family)
MAQIVRAASFTRLLTADEEVSLGRRIKIGQMASEAGNVDTDDVATATAIEDGKRAHDQLVLSNLRLAVSIAKRYTGHGLDLADLVQEGTIGLMRAADKFDYSLGFKFSTYAIWWVKQAISRGLADKARTIRLPVYAEEALAKLMRPDPVFERFSALDAGSKARRSPRPRPATGSLPLQDRRPYLRIASRPQTNRLPIFRGIRRLRKLQQITHLL